MFDELTENEKKNLLKIFHQYKRQEGKISRHEFIAHTLKTDRNLLEKACDCSFPSVKEIKRTIKFMKIVNSSIVLNELSNCFFYRFDNGYHGNCFKVYELNEKVDAICNECAK